MTNFIAVLRVMQVEFREPPGVSCIQVYSGSKGITTPWVEQNRDLKFSGHCTSQAMQKELQLFVLKYANTQLAFVMGKQYVFGKLSYF